MSPIGPILAILTSNLAHDPHWQSTPSHGESNFGDSSGPLISVYPKAEYDEDNKMVERWQKGADRILIFFREHSCHHPYIFAHKPERYGLVYSLPQLLRFFHLPSSS